MQILYNFGVRGEHLSSCYYNREHNIHALGLYLRDEHFSIDVTGLILKRAEEMASKAVSLPPEKFNTMVVEKMKSKQKIFKRASD